ncbi:MAG TPA: acyl-CoA dehydrogenase family protein [Methylomirabilota bacterium]|jgi:acyl-CoA dehydrogenase
MATITPSGVSNDWLALAHRLGPRFAERAAAHDADDSFVAENYAELKPARVFCAHIPAELGGGGASLDDICTFLRTLASYCGSTALALSMHTHQVATAVWRWRHDGGAIEPLLRRIAAEDLILVSSGGSDWLPGSGTAVKVEGGYRVSARKIFSSGCPSGDVLMTAAIYDDPAAGPTVLHFPLPLRDHGVKILDTWHTMGMRATGSHDVQIDQVFVPDAAINARRPQGKWHLLFHLTVLIAFPIIYAVYVGVAEAARDLAVREAAKKRQDPDVVSLVGEMDTELATARLALRAMIASAAHREPEPQATNDSLIARSLAGRAAIRTVEKAMEVVGGASFYRKLGLERLFRDIQGARYHPLQEKRQLRYTGRLALGLDIDE